MPKRREGPKFGQHGNAKRWIDTTTLNSLERLHRWTQRIGVIVGFAFVCVSIYILGPGPAKHRLFFHYLVAWWLVFALMVVNNRFPRWCSTDSDYSAMLPSRKVAVARVWIRRFQIELLLDGVAFAIFASAVLYASGFDALVARLWGHASPYVSTLANWLVSGIVGNGGYQILRRQVVGTRNNIRKAALH